VLLARTFLRRGAVLELPDLNVPSFGKLRISAMLEALDSADAASDPTVRWRFIGSSMGGYLAALWAEMNPDRVDRLLLLCPGFGLHDRWENLVGATGLAEWKRKGVLPLRDSDGRLVPVHYRLVEDMALHTRIPEVPCPTLIIHGTRDVIVPIEMSRRYAASRPNVDLIEVDDDHLLQSSLFRIEKEAAEFFAISG
jgi:hypothetical protein